MVKEQYKVLLVAGYHVREAKFGRDVIDLFKTQHAMPNVFFYNVEDNKGCAGCKRYKKVDKEIKSKIAEFEPDLLVDIHHGNAPLNSPMDDERVLIPGTPFVELRTLKTIRDPADYIWLETYIMSTRDSTFLNRGPFSNPYDKEKSCATWIGLEAYLGSLKTKPFDSEAYAQEVKLVTSHIEHIIESYCGFRDQLLESDFEKKVAEDLKKHSAILEKVLQMRKETMHGPRKSK